MGGGLMQLVAYGAQDIYLTGNPQITFFKVVYRRHTNFSMESIEQTFNGTADFGRKVTCTISRNGDLINKVYLQVTLPEIDPNLFDTNHDDTVQTAFRWLNWIGHVLIKNVEVEIGGQRIDKHYGAWLHIWNELTQTSGHQVGYASMVGNVPRLTTPVVSKGVLSGSATKPRALIPQTTLYIPLQFWFCRNPGLSLPLIALQYHEVRINLEFEDAVNCFWAVTRTQSDTSPLGHPTSGGDLLSNRDSEGVCSSGSGHYSKSCYYQVQKTQLNCCTPQLRAASLYVDYIYLDTDERRRMAQVSHEYLIEQLQFTGAESVNSTSNKIKLNFNHPCKELVWTVQPNSNVNHAYCVNFGGQQHFNFTDNIDQTWFTGVPGDGVLGEGMVSPDENSYPYNNSLSLGAGLPGESALNMPINLSTSGIDFGAMGLDTFSPDMAGVGQPGFPSTMQWFDDGHPGMTWFDTVGQNNNVIADQGKNPVVAAKLQLNGHDRFSERLGRYFNLVQPYQHHTNVPMIGINVYSFGLKPEEHQPSGTCNMSRIDNATLHLTLTTNAVMKGRSASVCIYATNYNVLRIMSGMGGLAYSN